jgi:hypothetical protein
MSWNELERGTWTGAAAVNAGWGAREILAMTQMAVYTPGSGFRSAMHMRRVLQNVAGDGYQAMSAKYAAEVLLRLEHLSEPELVAVCRELARRYEGGTYLDGYRAPDPDRSANPGRTMELMGQIPGAGVKP